MVNKWCVLYCHYQNWPLHFQIHHAFFLFSDKGTLGQWWINLHTPFLVRPNSDKCTRKPISVKAFNDLKLLCMLEIQLKIFCFQRMLIVFFFKFLLIDISILWIRAHKKSKYVIYHYVDRCTARKNVVFYASNVNNFFAFA